MQISRIRLSLRLHHAAIAGQLHLLRLMVELRSSRGEIFIRSGTYAQAALLPSDSACPRQGPLAPRELPRFYATMGLSDSRHGHQPVIYSRPMLAEKPPPCRVSQVPRCDCPSAPSPITPGCPSAANARCFTSGGGLHHIRKIGHTHWCNEAETGSLALGLTRSQFGRFTPFATRLTAETGPLLVVGYPCTRGRCYMMNEQLSWPTPFSQQVAPDLAWRTGGHGEHGEDQERISHFNGSLFSESP